jgi:two-component system chemotaxis sensor kinase CheA
MPSDHSIDQLRGLLRKIGLELAFLDTAAAELPGSLTALFDELTAALGSDVPTEFAAAIAAARGWLTRPTNELAEQLGLWHPWAEEALTAWSREAALPAWPTALPPLEAGATAATVPAAPAQVRRQALAADAAAQPVKVLPDSWDAEMMRLFCAEAEELLQDIEQGVLVLETAPADADTLATVFRSFHTLKGNAAVMKLVVLQRLTHELESLLDAARRGSRPLDRDAIDVVLAGADAVAQYVAETVRQLDGLEPGRAILLPVPAIIERVHGLLATAATGGLAAAPAPGTVPLPAKPAPRPAPAPAAAPSAPTEPAPRAGSEALVAAFPAAPQQPEVPSPTSQLPTSQLPTSQLPTGQLPTSQLPTGQPAARPVTASAGSVRVDTAKLDSLLDLVGELVIAQSMVIQAAGRSDEGLTRSLAQLRGITTDLQRTAMAMRMVPIRGAFQKLGRLVRDTASQLGKEIRLVVEGEETELDRTVIEEIGDPLMHMVRNAADHAIEPPAERIAAGKPRAGTITLEAFHQGGFVVVRISDDGRGLDPARIRAKAIEREIIAADAALDLRDTLELIFAPGFSTAEQVSDLSGRGVGLDVVRRNVERVRGKVEVESVLGRGTVFTIYMPLTLAIIEGLVVAVAGQRFVIPALAVRESFRCLPGQVATVHGRGELVDVRGQRVPLVRLAGQLELAQPSGPATGIVVVLEAGNDRRCLLVDELLGKQEVVIKSLGETFAGGTLFAGAAILGDGRVGLILDATNLVRLGRRSSTETAA